MKTLIKIDNLTYFLPNHSIIIKYFKEEEVNENDILINNRLEDYKIHDFNDYYTSKTFDKIFPTSIGVFLTHGCNLKCKYCYYESGGDNYSTLSYDQIDAIIKYLIKCAIIRSKVTKNKPDINVTLSGGGEPTYHWDKFTYFIDMLKERCNGYNIKTKIHLVSNGIWKKEYIPYITKNVDVINLSFDGLPNIQNTQRPLKNGGESFHILMETIEGLNNSKFRFSVRSTLSPMYFKQMKEITKNFLENYEYIQGVHIEPIFMIGRASNMKTTSTTDAYNFLNYFIETYEWVLREYPNRNFRCSRFDQVYKPIYCGALIGNAPWINSDGYVMPCLEKIDTEKYCLAKLEGNEFITKNENKFYQETIAGMKAMECMDCYAFNFCGGGCPNTMPRSLDGKFSSEEAELLCSTTREFWKRAFNELASGNPFLKLKSIPIDINTGKNDFMAYKIVKV